MNRRLNIYTCPTCGFNLLSEDVDDGVTPFSMPCSCGLNIFSHFYKVGQEEQSLPADIVWYKPNKDEIRKMSKSMREYIKNGGLQYRVNSPKAQYLDIRRNFYGNTKN